MKSDFLIAITQLCAEKNLPKEVVFEAIEAALISAYKRNFSAGQNQNVTVKIVPSTGEFKVFAEKEVVETVTDRRAEVSLTDARKVKRDVQLGELIEVESTPNDFGRIAAQTAKQVVVQRLREAEREAVFEEFSDKARDIVSGTVQRIEPKRITIDLGKVEAVLPEEEQVPGERYRPGQRVKALLVEVRRTPKGPEVRVSRTHRELVKRLFELEVPEIYQGAVELKAIAREPGSRSKVAVAARQEGVDPVGACVGMRSIRIQNIRRELNDEKIDVVQWHPDPAIFVANALSPAQVLSVEVNEDEKTATVVVPDRQLSLAIGKEGQNARLAAKMTNWRIDIKSATAAKAERAAREAQRAAEAAARAAEPVEVPPVSTEIPPAFVADVSVAPQPGTDELSAEPMAEVVEAPAIEEVPVEAMPPIDLPTPEEAPVVEALPAYAGTYTEVEEPPVEEAPAPVVGEEIPEQFTIDDLVMPAPAEFFEQQPRIRFAEDLFGEGGASGKKKAKSGKRQEERERDVAKTKRPSKKLRMALEEDDDELTAYEEYIKGSRR